METSQQSDQGEVKMTAEVAETICVQQLGKNIVSMFRVLSSNSSIRKYLPGAVCLAGTILFYPQVGMTQTGGPFAGYTGSWQGSGRVVGANGNTERIKCRATYTVSPDGAGMTQALICASDSYRFDIHSNVISDGRSVRGTWEETTRDATGNLAGEVRGGQFEGAVSGPGFSAEMRVRTTGRQQVVSINPQGADVTKVDITLTR